MLKKGQDRDSGFETRPLRFRRYIKHLWRVGTGRDGILHYSPLRARDRVILQTRPLLSLPTLADASLGLRTQPPPDRYRASAC
jgi:hypothetical protein